VVGVVVVSTAAGEAASTEEAAMVGAVSMAGGMVEEAFMADPPTADIMAGAIVAGRMAAVAMGILPPEGPGRPRVTECGTLHRDSIHSRDQETARACQPLVVREWPQTAALA
jgi:hypothetical protein